MQAADATRLPSHRGERSEGAPLDGLDRPVIVAVIAVGMVKVSLNKIVDMVAVRHGGMPAPRSMDMVGGVAAALVLGRARRRVGRVHLELVLLHLAALWVVQVTVMKIVDVIAVLNGRVAAARPVLVRMVGVVAHSKLLLKERNCKS